MNCTRCKKDHNENGKMCRECLNYADTLRKNKLSKGMCQVCSGPLASKRFCQTCLDKQRLAYEAKVQSGECTQCSNKAAANSPNCLLCQQRRRVWKYGISIANYDNLLVKQSGKCPLCSANLAETDCNIDHDHRCCTGMSGKGKRTPACGKCVRGIVCWRCNRFLVAWGDTMLNNPTTAAMLESEYTKLFFYLTSRFNKTAV